MDGPKGEEEETRASYDTGHAPRHTHKKKKKKRKVDTSSIKLMNASTSEKQSAIKLERVARQYTFAALS